MPLLNGVVLYEYGERRTFPGGRKVPAKYRSLYVTKPISDEDRKILKQYYLSKRAKQRLVEQSHSIFKPFGRKQARLTLQALAIYEITGVCIPWKVWWQDEREPMHPLSVIQWYMFKEPLNRPNRIDITGGLAFWLSERGRAKNKELHEIIDDIVITYLHDVMPWYKDAARGLVTGDARQAVVEEIEHRAQAAVMAIVVARAQYGELKAPARN